jgi:hypothetical protein
MVKKRMTANTVQKATLAIAAAVLAITVAGYMALASPAAAQTSTSTSTSSTWVPPGWTTGFPPYYGGPFGQGWTTSAPPYGGPFGYGPPMMRGWAGGFPGYGGPFGWGPPFAQSQVSLSVGQTITITSTSGNYYVVGTPSKNGTASGTLTFKVTGKLYSGYTLSITGGSVTMAGTPYAITSGTAQLIGFGIMGQGATSPTGQFILHAMAYGSFTGSTGQVYLDLQAGSSEYLVYLTGSVTS